jgi:hypothetical protein
VLQLGSGSRDRDMQMLQGIAQKQELIICWPPVRSLWSVSWV